MVEGTDEQSGVKANEVTNGSTSLNMPTTISTEGTTTLSITTTDWAGLNANNSYSIKIDKTAPNISNVTVDEPTLKGFNVTIEATDKGIGEVKEYTIYYKKSTDSDYQNITTSKAKYTFSNLNRGTTYNIYVTATDSLGNISENSAIQTITTTVLEDGTWDSEKNVNSPYLHEGLNPVIWVGTTEITKYVDETTKAEINSQWTANNGDEV